MTMPLVILLSLIHAFSTQTSCNTPFDCSSTACCKNNICVDQSECQITIRNYYIIVGSIGAFFILSVFIYFISVISNSRQRIKKIKEIVTQREKEIEELHRAAFNNQVKN
jgi:hypothetical protein